MTRMNPADPQKPRALGAQRITLLASVAALGAFVVLAGPSLVRSPGLEFGAQSARAAETTSLPHPASFADIVAKVKPAVVSVRVQITGGAEPATMQQDQDDEQIPFAPGSPLEKFFQQFGQGFGQQQHQAPQPHRTVVGEGSGFFISPDGYAVTNNHVVDHAKSVQVTTEDGTIYKARVVGTDPKTDLALIKVDAKSDLPYVKFAQHEPRVGDWVVAVGNPFGLGGTVTAGIVSASARNIGAGPYDDYIQIDAPINKGNSGGPAFDVEGNVIGINTAIFSPSGGSVGIGFDIPATTAKLIVAQLKDHGHVTRGWLGVQIQPVTPALADSLGLKKAEGAIIDQAQPGSPALKAGLQSGDVITSVNGTPVKDARDLARLIAVVAPDKTVKLDIVRQGESRTVSVTLAAMPNEQQASVNPARETPSHSEPHLGLSLAPASDVPGSGGEGVVVTAVEPDGPAADLGFEAGNVILNIGGKTVGNIGDVVKAIEQARASGKHAVLMRVKAKDGTHFVAVPLGNA